MALTRRHPTLRAAMALALTYLMVWGSVPAPALAQMVEEATVTAQSAEPAPAAQGEAGGTPESQSQGEPAGVATEASRVAVPSVAEGLSYDGTEQVGVTAGDGYELAGDVAATHAGDYVATATPAEGHVWEDGTSGAVELRWSIARRGATVTADDKSKAKGEADPELTATIEGLVGDDKVAYELTRDAGEEPGGYDITPSGEAVQGDYEVSFAAGTMTVAEPVTMRAQASGERPSGTWGTCQWEIDANGTLTVHPGEGASQNYSTPSPWEDHKGSVASVVFAREGESSVILPSDCSHLLSGLDKATSMDLSGADASNVTDMRGMFEGCTLLKTIRMPGWDVSNVTDMYSLFDECPRLETMDLSGWNLGNTAPSFAGMRKLSSLNVSGWQTGSLGSMGSMFYGCSSLTSLDLSGWDVSKVTSMDEAFYGCSSLASVGDLSTWDMSQVTHMGDMFSGCSQLASVGDLSGWDVSKVTSMYDLFYGCSSLASVGDLSRWDMGSVTCIMGLFSGCSSLTSVGDLSKWDISPIGQTSGVFSGCSQLTSVGDLSTWDMSQVTHMDGMFSGCSQLTSVGDLSGWDTSKVKDMHEMFSGCSSLASVGFLYGWDTSKVENMHEMFSGCTRLTSLDLSRWDTSSVEFSYSIFSNCASLSEVRVGKNHRLQVSSLPNNELNGTRYWYSKALGRFLSFNDLQNRQGVADVYLRRFGRGEIPMSSTRVTLPSYETYTYDGTQKKPEVTVTLGAQTLRNGTDYEVRYSNNTDAGTATVTVVGKGYYSGSKSATFRIDPATINYVSVKGGRHIYDGYEQTPDIERVEADYSMTVPASGYTVSYANNVNVGTATVTVTGRGNYTGSATSHFSISEAPRVEYRTHVQRKGWQRYVADGAMSGTSGKSLRLEGINIYLNRLPYSGGIQYRTHVQRIGWQGWRKYGRMAGTSGKSLRLEAIEIKLYGEVEQYYDVYYRVHCQKFGWMGWAKNGQRSGSAGYSRRLEGIQIVLVKKGRPGPGPTLNGITQRFSAPFKQKGKK